MMQLQVAIYARVSNVQQAEAGTIKSQLAELQQRVAQDGFSLSPEFTFIDEGYSGASLIRPGLERLRDVVAMHGIDRLYVHSPDRLARKYAYQVLLVDEFERSGVEVIFLNRPLGQSPEDALLLQVQGMIAEYERAKIMERNRRGKRHAAQNGQVSALSAAPYGYRYISKQDGDGQARYDIVLNEARVVRQIFQWSGHERVSIGEICRRLKQKGELTPTGKSNWVSSVVWNILKNPAYKGMAAFGKTKSAPFSPKMLHKRGKPLQPRRLVSKVTVPKDEWIYIEVPALVSEELFEVVQAQLEENRQRARQYQRGASYLLQGLLVCANCRYAYCSKPVTVKAANGKKRHYVYYRCSGMDAYRFGKERICNNPQVRADILEEVVWNEVTALLAEPHRIEEEYQRRLSSQKNKDKDMAAIQVQSSKVKKGITRLIDGYTDGLIEKQEFKPRINNLRQRLTELESQAQQLQNELNAQTELRLVITRLEELAKKVKDGLSNVDWSTKRELIRTLVKRVEIGKEEVKVVFRITPDPFELNPNREILPHCSGRLCLQFVTTTSVLKIYSWISKIQIKR